MPSAGILKENQLDSLISELSVSGLAYKLVPFNANHGGGLFEYRAYPVAPFSVLVAVEEELLDVARIRLPEGVPDELFPLFVDEGGDIGGFAGGVELAGGHLKVVVGLLFEAIFDHSPAKTVVRRV